MSISSTTCGRFDLGHHLNKTIETVRMRNEQLEIVFDDDDD